MVQRLFDLSGKLAIVTGASRGLGFAMPRGFAEAGARVVLNGRDDGRWPQRRRSLPTRVSPPTAAFDVSDTSAVEAALADIEARLGPLHILVNNAGIAIRGQVVETTDAAWREVMATNLDAAFWMARGAGRRMAARGAGKIINVSSMIGFAARAAQLPTRQAKPRCTD